VGEIGFLRGDLAGRLATTVWLENYAASFDAGADLTVPDRFTTDPAGGVCFSYADASKVALDNITVHLPPAR